MSGWAAKRFWTEAAPWCPRPAASACGSTAGRCAPRPRRRWCCRPRRWPRRWRRNGRRRAAIVDPRAMPCTRMANSAIDKVAPHAGRGRRAGRRLWRHRPAVLPRRGAGRTGRAARRDWDAPLDWAAGQLGARLRADRGRDAGARRTPPRWTGCTARVARAAPFELAPFHDLVALSGSLVLGLAVARGRLTAAEAWRAVAHRRGLADRTLGPRRRGRRRPPTARRTRLSVRQGLFLDAARGKVALQRVGRSPKISGCVSVTQ